MSKSSVHSETIELLLRAMSRRPGSGLRSSFMFGKPGAPMWERNIGAEVFFDSAGLIQAALYARQHGHSYLRYVAVGEIASMLQRFVTENFWYLSEVLFSRADGPGYAQLSTPEAKTNLASALAKSTLFQPENELTVYPLVPIRVVADFDSAPFFIVAPASLVEARLPAGVAPQFINSMTFPPLAAWEGRREFPTAWLGVRSPAYEASNKIKRAVLGALALTPLPGYRHLFSMRSMFGGRCTIGSTSTTSFGEPHTPPLAHDIGVSADDHSWLTILAKKLLSEERTARREIRALEYYYRAWELEPSERFPILYMALDAVLGDASHATQAIIEGVRKLLGTHIPEIRLRSLVELRASVIHGGAPDVYDSRKYARYYRDYGTDPIGDMELIVAKCLQLQIFSGCMKCQSDPNASLLVELRVKGVIPNERRHGGSILEEH